MACHRLAATGRQLRRRACLPGLGRRALLLLRRSPGCRRAPARRNRLLARGPKPASPTTPCSPPSRTASRPLALTGEGHRKVWARLRVIDGIRVARKRVLRLMREHALLSPHRARQRSEAAHDRRIITEAPNIMWAIDATQITTVQDGKVWLFGVAEHLERRTARLARQQSAAPASKPSRPSAWRSAQQFGRLSAGAGPRPGASATTTAATSWPTTSRDRPGSGAWRRATPSSASRKPMASSSSLFRTLKEQAVHGRVFQTIDEVRRRHPRLRRPATTPNG